MVDLRWGAATDTGLVRGRNEDAMLAQRPVFVVADGMGGRPGGAIASRIAVEQFESCARSELSDSRGLLDALERGHSAVRRFADGQLVGMGTTIVGLALVEDEGSEYWFGFNVGDSRLYRYAAGGFEQLSVDHSEVQELVDAGLISALEGRSHPGRHVVTRVVGGGDVAPVADCWLLCPVPGERFLLCSDGLSDELDDERLQQVVSTEPDPGHAARRLVAEAVAAGGHDNVTVVVVDVAGGDDQALLSTARRQRTARAAEAG